jgi:hypothetical protein
MDHQTLIDKILAKREEWVELESAQPGDGADSPGKAALRVKVRRPPESDLPRYRAGFNARDVVECCVGWDGFTEADLLGSGVGASSPVPFAPELWEVVCLDRTPWITKVANKLVDLTTAHLVARKEAAKN